MFESAAYLCKMDCDYCPWRRVDPAGTAAAQLLRMHLGPGTGIYAVPEAIKVK